MRRSFARGSIRPKISTMPRQASEAAAFLDIYKLVVEKKRLQQELQAMDERRKHVCDRLVVLEQHIAEMEGTIQHMRTVEGGSAPLPSRAMSRGGNFQASQVGSSPVGSSPMETFETLFLEY